MAREIKHHARPRTETWDIYEADDEELVAHVADRLGPRPVRRESFDPDWVVDPQEPLWFQEAMDRLHEGASGAPVTAL